jgi:hypothetical protein
MKEAMTEFRGFIRDVGFPIFVAVYFLVSLSPKLDKLTTQIERAVILLEVKR